MSKIKSKKLYKPMQDMMVKGSSDDFQTPKIALNPLIPFLKKDWVIWECACGEGNLVEGLREAGFEVIGTDILDGHDFLKWQPEHFDCIITNPPFSLKLEFIQRCYTLGKPFALLLPLTTFETAKRQAFFKKYGVEVVFFDKRINFTTPKASGSGRGSWFATMWLTNWLNLPAQLNFTKLEGKYTLQKTIEEI